MNAFGLGAFVEHMYKEESKKGREVNDILEEKTTEYGKCNYEEIDFDENLINEAESIWAEVQSDESLRDMSAPSDMKENVFKIIREKETEHMSAAAATAESTLSDEDRELIRLGKIYRRKRKKKKLYLLVAAVLVMMFAFGMTCTGEDERLFGEMLRWVGNREQNQVNSDVIIPIEEITEEEVYQQIEDEYGVLPVRMMYYPEGIGLQKVSSGEAIQGTNMSYGDVEKNYIKYIIRPNYREASWGKDIEDKLLDEYEMTVDSVAVRVRKYLAEDESLKWAVDFKYRDVSYSIKIHDYDQDEVEKIVQNLFFYK